MYVHVCTRSTRLSSGGAAFADALGNGVRMLPRGTEASCFCAHLNRLGVLTRIAFAAVCAGAALANSSAWATTCSYQIAISEDLGRLERTLPGAPGPGDPAFAPEISSTTSAEWVYLRNHPYIAINNASDDGVSIQTLNIQLNNLTGPDGIQNLSQFNPTIDVYAFHSFDNSLPSITNVQAVNASGSSGSSITLTLANFDPGATLIFRLDLTPASKKYTSFADYRVVFTKFDDSTNTTGNATSTVTFNSPDSSDPNPVSGPNAWPNLASDLEDQTSMGIAYSCLNSPDTIVDIPASGGTTPQVPEPSTALLAGLGIAGILLGRTRLTNKKS